MEKAFIFQKIFAISYCGRAHQEKLRMRFLMHLLIFLQLKKYAQPPLRRTYARVF